jgi:hypothetical protein
MLIPSHIGEPLTMTIFSARIRFILVPLTTAALSLGLGSCMGAPTPIERDETGEVAEVNESADVFALELGDCVDEYNSESEIESGEEVEIETVPVVPCSEPHDYEVYLSHIIDSDTYPGDDEMVTLADDTCFDAFEPFVGLDYDSSRFTFGTMYPSQMSWNGLDDREILCLITDINYAKLTGSVAGIAE